jgi:hypothetical protein
MAVQDINIFQFKAVKIYPNWHCWFENKPSGNPASHLDHNEPRTWRNVVNYSDSELLSKMDTLIEIVFGRVVNHKNWRNYSLFVNGWCVRTELIRSLLRKLKHNRSIELFPSCHQGDPIEFSLSKNRPKCSPTHFCQN